MIPTSHGSRRCEKPRCRQRAGRGLRRGGFTLLEVLVVVGIIALLLSIMLPSMMAARREAQRVACQANLKQVVFGWRGYLDENNGWFPHVALADINFGGRQGEGSPDGKQPYQGKKPVNKHLKLPLIAKRGAEVFCCPSDTGGGIDPNDSTQSEISPSYFRYYGTSYWTNPLLAGAMPLAFAAGDPCKKHASEFNKTLPYMNSSRFDQESKLLLAADAGWYKAWTSRRWTSRGINPVVDWHRAGRRYNVGFMDGHADFVEIVRGMYTTGRYTVMPTFELQNESVVCQSSK